jgi:hypothetical protein
LVRTSVLNFSYEFRYDLALTFAPGSHARMNRSRLKHAVISSERVGKLIDNNSDWIVAAVGARRRASCTAWAMAS